MTAPTPFESSLPRPADSWPDWSILIVDDEPGMRNFLVKSLAPRCRNVHSAGSAEEGAQFLLAQHVDLLILDIALPGQSGVEWLKVLREGGYRGHVILITAFADLETAIEALRAGASDFILKPFRVPQILNAIKHCFESSRLQRENFVLRHTLSRQVGHAVGLIGRSDAMAQVRSALPRVAAVDSTVLLQGESGTGKELVARALHALSARASGPFVPVNCAAMAQQPMESALFGHAKGAFPGATQPRDGLFYYAQGGTLFLDEVAELPLALQASLLRVVEERCIRPLGSNHAIPVNVRIVAATNRPLDHEVALGRFRSDLYYRLQVVQIALSPLREHVDDVADLVAHFMSVLGANLGVPPLALSNEQLAFLKQYPWPGNVRELRNLVERSLILGELNVSALYGAPPPSPSMPVATNLQQLEKRHILSILESVQGDKTRAADLLGISRRTLERRCAEWAST